MKVAKIPLIAPIGLTRVENHAEIKDELMSLINDAQAERIVDDNCQWSLDITRCDYNTCVKPETFGDVMDPSWSDQFVERKWVDFLQPHLTPAIDAIYTEMGYHRFKVNKIWFQQYDHGSTHGWHAHTDCQWTSVYYVDLPDDSPRTQILNPFTQHDIQTLEVQEGDVVCFPSYVIHQAPTNKGDKTKTIVSWNSDVDIGPAYEVQ